MSKDNLSIWQRLMGKSAPETVDTEPDCPELVNTELTEAEMTVEKRGPEVVEEEQPITEENGLEKPESGEAEEKFDKVDSVKAPKKVKKLSVKSKAKGQLKITWKNRKCDGYRIQLSMDSEFENTVDIITFGTKNKTKQKIVDLVSGEKYYVRVQAYKLIGGEELCGKFSKAMKVKIK